MLPTENEVKESKNMKKFFKTPEDLKLAGFDAYKQMLNAYMKKEKAKLDDTPFILVADFEFKDPKTAQVEIAPILFLGTPNTQWKQAIKSDFKKRKTFAQGFMDLIDNNGNMELGLIAETGKGAKNKNLKELKKLPGIKNIFNDIYFTDEDSDKEEDDIETNAKNEVNTGFITKENTDINVTDNELQKLTKKSPQLVQIEDHFNALKNLTGDDADDRLDELYFMKLLILDWKSMYKEGEIFDRENALITKMDTFIQHSESRLTNLDAKQELIDIYRNLKQLKIRVEKRPDLPMNVRLKYYEEYITINTEFKNWYHIHRAVVETNTDLEKLYQQFRSDREQLKTELLKGLDSPEKAKLLELKAYTVSVGYNPKDIKKINEITDLTDFPSRKFTDRGLHLVLENLQEKYIKLPLGDVEGRRLLLWDMLTSINNHLNENEGEIDSKKAAELKEFGDKLYAKISAIADFEAAHDNYVTILNLYDNFIEKATAYQDNKNALKNADPTDRNKLEKELGTVKNELLTIINKINEECNSWKEKHKHVERFDIKKKRQQVDHIVIEVSNTIRTLGDLGVDVNTIDPKIKLKKLYKAKKDKDFHKIDETYHNVWDGHKDIEAYTKKLKKNQTPKLEKYHTKDLERLIRKMNEWLFDYELYHTNDELEENKKDIEEWKKDIEILISLADMKHDEMEARDREKKSMKMYEEYKNVIGFALEVEKDFQAIDKKVISEEQKKEEKMQIIQSIHPTLSAKYNKLKPAGMGFAYEHGDPNMLNRFFISYVTKDGQALAKPGFVVEDYKKSVVNIQGALQDLENGHVQYEKMKRKLFEDHLGKDSEAQVLLEILSENKSYFNEIWELIKAGGDKVSENVVKKVQELIRSDRDIRKKISKGVVSKVTATKLDEILEANADKVTELLDRLTSKHHQVLDLLKDYTIEDEDNEFNSKVLEEFPLDKIDKFVNDKKELHKEIVKAFDELSQRIIDDSEKEEDLRKLLNSIEDKVKAWDQNVSVIVGPNAKTYLKELDACREELLDIQKLIPVYSKYIERGEESLSISMRNYYQLMSNVHEKILAQGKDLAKMTVEEKEDAVDQQRLVLDLYESYKLYQNLFYKKIQEYFKGNPEKLLKKLNEKENLDTMSKEIVDVISNHCKYGEIRNDRRELIDFLNDYKEELEKLHTNLITNLNMSLVSQKITTATDLVVNTRDETLIRNTKRNILDELNEIEKDAIRAAAEEDREDIVKLMYKFQGQSVYTDGSNVENMIPKEEMSKVKKAANLISQRALRLLELGYNKESQELTVNIPNTFLPAEFIQEKRIFEAVDKALIGFNKDEITLANMEKELSLLGDTGNAWEALGKAFEITGDTKIDDNTKLMGSLTSLSEIFKAGGTSETMKEYATFSDEFTKFQTEFAKSNDGKVGTIQDYISGKGLNEEQTGRANQMHAIHEKAEADKNLANVLKAVAFGGKVVLDSIGTVMEGIEAFKGGDDKAVTAFALNVISKISDWGASGIEFAEVDQLKPIQAVLKSVSVLTKFMSGEVSLKSQLSSLEFWDDTVSNLFELGGGVGEIIGIFTPVGGIITSSFALFKDAKDLYKFIKVCHKKAKLLNRAKLLQERAEMDSSNFLAATKGIVKNAQDEYTKAQIDVAGKSIHVLGDGTMIVGSVMTLTPIAPIGLAVSIGGKILKALGSGLIMAYDTYKELKDFAETHHVKKYIKAARKGNLEAIDYILERKIVYAQAFIVYGAIDRAEVKGKDEDVKLDPDPIVEHYCSSLGIDIDNMDEDTATKIVKEQIWGKDAEISVFTNRFDNYANDKEVWDYNSLKSYEDDNNLGKKIEEEIHIYFECKKFQSDHFIINKIAKLDALHEVKERKKSNLVALDAFLLQRQKELDKEIHSIQNALKSVGDDVVELKNKTKELKTQSEKREMFKQYRKMIPSKALA